MQQFYSQKKECTDFNISRYCVIKNGRVIVNEDIVFEGRNLGELSYFLSDIYKEFSIEYPKFFKMDLLCKLGFLTAEMLFDLKNYSPKCKKEELAIVIANAYATLETDAKFQDSIGGTHPNPALFAYASSNVLGAEIAIRHKIKGENAFFILQLFDFQLLWEYSKILVESTTTKSAVVGWIDVDANKNYESGLFLIERIPKNSEDTKNWAFTAKKMEELFLEKNLEVVENVE